MVGVRRDDINFIAEHYGYEGQSRQLIEEMAELTQAINKFWRKHMKYGMIEFGVTPVGTPEEKNIIEEIADVEVCLAQVKHLFTCNEEVNEIARMKVQRELKRIEDSKHDKDNTSVESDYEEE